MTGSNSIIQTLKKYEPRSLHHELDIVWDWAEGYEVGSVETYYKPKQFVNFVPKTYIDFTSGIFVANIGHGREEIIKALVKQLSKPLLHTYTFPNEVRAQLVKKLAELSGMEKVFLCSTGSEAIEAALRCMLAYAGSQKLWRGGIWGLEGAFHGNTAGSKNYINKWLNEKLHGLRDDMPLCHWGYGYIGQPLGLIIESYCGWNAKFHNTEWIQRIVHEAQEHKVPVCFDEIQAGFGRTGKMFGYQHYDVQPDIIVVGKGLSSSLPIAAVMGRAELLDAPDDLSSTHTGNPLCCAAALASLEVLEKENLVERAADMGQRLQPLLNATFLEYTVTGRGMVWGIDLQDKDLTNRVVDECAKNGLLLVKTHRGTIKIGAPLITPFEVMKEGIEILRKAVTKCTSGT